MKKLMCLALGAAVACFVAATSFAAGGSGLEVHGLYAFNFNDDDDGSNLDNAFGGGASFVFNLSDNVKLDLGADYIKPEYKDDSSSKVQFIPVCAALRFGGNLEQVFLYAGGGAGYSFNDLDTPSTPGVDIDIDDSMVYFACGGAEFNLNEDLYIRGEFRYNWLQPEVKVTAEGWGEDKQDVKCDHMQVRAGLGFNF
jgi:opacity protein-like surface antigen